MSTEYDFNGKKIYLADTKEEWRELIKAGHIAYTKDEVKLGTQVPNLSRLGDFIYQIKQCCPEAIIVGANDVSRECKA